MKKEKYKYTEEFVEKELGLLLEQLEKNKDIIYLGQLFEGKSYTRQRFSEWYNEFKDNKEIQRKTDTIKEILESRAVAGAMSNKLNATFTIFHLKNNYNWKDKTEVENTNKNINIETEDKEEFKNLLKDNNLI